MTEAVGRGVCAHLTTRDAEQRSDPPLPETSRGESLDVGTLRRAQRSARPPHQNGTSSSK
jgi:hypothetical protein